jgi:hypothetical protein
LDEEKKTKITHQSVVEVDRERRNNGYGNNYGRRDYRQGYRDNFRQGGYRDRRDFHQEEAVEKPAAIDKKAVSDKDIDK